MRYLRLDAQIEEGVGCTSMLLSNGNGFNLSLSAKHGLLFDCFFLWFLRTSLLVHGYFIVFIGGLKTTGGALLMINLNLLNGTSDVDIWLSNQTRS